MNKWLLAGFLSIFSLQGLAQSAPGEQFSRVGSNTLAWECRGAGDKTVLLIAGMGLDAHATYKNTFRNFSAPATRSACMTGPASGKAPRKAGCAP